MVNGAQIRAARAVLGWSQERLAGEAKIAKQTLVRLESGRVRTNAHLLEAVREVLMAAGVEFGGDQERCYIAWAAAAQSEDLTKTADPGTQIVDSD